jgi:guanylate kinase
MAGQAALAIENPVGCLFIVAAPSGGGKTSLVQQLIANLDQIDISVSHTTRPKRPGEVEGVDYFFVNPETFQCMIEGNAFVEHAQVFDHQYGTSIEQITRRLQQGLDLVLDIDWQGAQQIKRVFPHVVKIFILPPSLDVLRERLEKRQQDNEHVIARRMQCAQEEMRHVSEFDYVIVNDNFDKAAQELATIVMAERLRFMRQSIKQRKLLSFLLAPQ